MFPKAGAICAYKKGIWKKTGFLIGLILVLSFIGELKSAISK